MKRVIKINLFLVPILALLLVLSPVAPAVQATALFHGGLEPQNWTLAGPGTRTRQPASGPTGSIVFNYVYNGHYGQWHTWDFYTTPTTTETITFPWRYQPFHSWYQSKSRLYVFTNGTSGPMTNLVDSYGIIDVNGTVTVNVVAGQTFGFRMQAYHFDGSNITNGTLTVGTPVPYLQVSGSTTYTENAPPVVVAPGLTLTGPDIDGAKASIGANFNAAQDSLGISGQTGTSGTVSGVNWSYNATTGVMALSGAGTSATYQAALRQVTFSNNSQNPSSAPRTVTFSIGQNTLYYPGTGHYYEYVSAPGMYWTDAKTAAEARYYYGLQGYLVTIMDAGENSFASSKITGMGWMGGSDSAVEGTWRWVTGPEAGTLFSGHYTNWASGEPNNLGNEDYAHFYTNGLWNDFYNNNGSIQGYVVEYGGAPGDPSLSLSGSVTVNIQPVNDPPVANNGSATTNEDTAKAITLTGSDVEGSALTFAIATAPAHGTATVAGSTATYTPALNYSGPDSFTFTASDGSLASAPATITMTVNPVNDAPVANGASVSTNEDTSKAITLTGSDVEGSTLTFTIADAPDHGTVSGTAPNVTYAPAANFNGADSFTFTVNDGSLTSNAATISITVSPVNDAPVANNASVTTNEDAAKAITLTGSDVEGSPLTYSIVTAPAHGTANIAGSVATYTPATSYSGPDSFTFRANDGSLNSAPATIAITVNSVDDAPTANAGGPYSVAEGGTVTLSGSGSDPDGGAVVLEWDLNNDGQFDDANGAHPTFSAAGIDGPGVRNISLRVSERAGLFWDFENATSNGGISTSVGAAAGPKTSGIASQTGGGPVEDWGAPIGKVLLTRGLGPVNYPYMEFATTEVLQLDSVSFTHYHNHNPGFPTYNGYQVQLQINSGGGYSNLGSPLAINRNNNGQTSTMAGGSLSLNPGTYRIRWLASGFSSGDNSGSEFFGINDLSLNLVSVLKATSSTTVTINNVAPTVNAGPDASTNGAGLFTGSGSFTDPGPDTWTATVDYGDGSGVQPLALAGKNFNLSHTYANNGVYLVTVNVNDGDPGGTGTDTLNVTRIDTIAPTTTAARDVQPNAAGWNKTNVTVTLNAIDNTGGSGVREIRYSINGGAETIDPGATASLTLSTDGQYNITYYAKDNAGNSETGKSLNVNVDKTPPTIVFNTASPAPNGAGWNKTNVSVPFVASDALSGVASTTPAASPVVVSAEGAVVTGTVTATDVAGNTASFTTAAFKIDKTAPTIAGSRSPGPNANGWNNTDVTVDFTASDALSGLASVTPDTVLSGEGANQSVTGTAVDIAGNSATATVGSISIDKTKPTLTFGALVPAPNGAGWNNTDVSIGYTAGDALSGVASTSPATPLSFTTEGSNLTQAVTVVDKAGNTNTFTSPAVKLDKTAPTIAGSRSPGANANGWNNTDVTVHFTGSDGLSGMASLTPDTVLSGEGANQSVSGTATDIAGNSATATVGSISIDKTKPTLTFAALNPAPNAAGWNKTDVTIGYTPSDALSGVASSDPANPLSFTTEGSNLTQAVTVVDKAGNSNTFTSPVVKLDKTAPTLVFGTASPAANAAGWNNTNVSVPFAASDALSGVATTSPAASPVVLIAEGAAVTGSATVIDVAGNTATFTTAAFKIDKTAPTINGSRTPDGNANGWNNTDVTVHFTASDALSGMASLTPDTVLSGEGANQSVTGTATDAAGNSATATVGSISIDKTKPTLTFAALNPAPNAAGWNKTDVTIGYTPADALSGVDSSSPANPLSFTAEGANLTQTVTVVDKAGNSNTFPSPVVKIDKTAPVINGSRTPDGNANGWNNTDVTVHFTASDALSGMASLTPDTVLSGEGANQSVTGTAVDAAGNSATATVGSISIDKTKPTLTFAALSPAPNDAGWNKTDVTVGYTAADALSGVASTDPATPLSFTAEGANLSQTVTVVDKAGNSNTFTSPVVKIDKTAPTLVFGTPAPAANAAGWNKTNVSVPFTTNDNLSGVASTSPAASPVVISAEGAAVTGTATVTDVAGNTATFTTAAFKIDKTAPTINGSRTPGANANGWNNTDVTVHFTASDTLSGMASLTPDTVLSGEGANQSVTGTATDAAGNSATATVGSISIDKTKPTLAFAALNPAPNGAGWNKTDVTVGYTPADALSGVASTSPATPLSFTAEGANLTQTVTVLDKAGNSNTFTSPVVKIDKTAPTLVFGAASPVPNGAGWNNTNVSVPFTPGDALSGVASTTPAASPVVVSAEGAAVTGTVTVTDVAGNTASFNTAALKIDKTAPTIQGSRSPGANTYGWNNTDVTVHFTGSDTLSGVASLTPDTVLSAEAANQSVTGTVVDAAGNSATATVGSVSIDKTKPTLAFGPTTPAPNAAGWNRTDVTIAYTTNDTLSGVASATPASPLSFTTEGAALTQTVTVADKAGNTNTFTSQVVKLDKTLPTVGISSPQARDYLTSESFTVTYTNGDALSGVALVTAKLDTTTVTNGQVINLASMAGNHTLVVTVTDVAGNTNSASVSFRVIIAATIVIDPQTLNLKSQSDKNAVTSYIEFPTGYSVAQINVASVKLDVVGTPVAAQASPTSVGDNDGDGVADRMVKADRQSVIAALTGKTGGVTIVVTGTLTDGRAFTCRATINVINPGK